MGVGEFALYVGAGCLGGIVAVILLLLFFKVLG